MATEWRDGMVKWRPNGGQNGGMAAKWWDG
jgi:hypothetical protein